MGVIVLPSTMLGAVTPICNSCGIHLCWDLSEEEYNEAKKFWDDWICEDCNGGNKMSLKLWKSINKYKEANNGRS